MKYSVICWLCLLKLQLTYAQSIQLAKPLEQGHSHNDYWRPQPLFNALKLGFKSVEADVFLVNGALLVGHDTNELQPAKTLPALYLQPLADRIKTKGKLYRKAGQLWLYIDFKTDGPATYAALVPLLQQYRQLLINPQDKKERGAVRIILTGNYPRELVMNDKNRLVYLDGKLNDLTENPDPKLIPAISANWKQTFTWTGSGPMPAKELVKLQQLARQAQQSGQKIRFWNMPESDRNNLQAIWQQLVTSGSFLVGTDHLDWLSEMLAKRNTR